eukprot:jgi/Tetstr1/457721/TSEL_044267.t1
MSTSINTGMMNTSLANLARQSAIKTDPGDAPPPPHFRDDTSSSDDAFSMDEASDSDSGDIQHIKPAAVKPTLNLKNVPIWDNTISTRDNAQAIKIALGSAGYLDTTKGKGTRQEQMMLLAALRHATAHYPMALAIVNSISMDSRKCGYAAWTALFTELQGSAIEERRRLEEEITAGQLPNEPVQVYVRRCRNLWNLLRKAHGQWTFEYVAINYLIPGLHPAYDHIVDATIPATNVTKRLATIISAGQNMEARTRQRQQRARSRTPTLNSCDPSDQLHAIRPNIVCSSGLPVMLTCTTTAPGGAATGAQEGEGEDDDDDEFHESWHVPYSNSDDNFQSALATHDVHTGQGALRGDLPPPLPILTAAPLLHMPSSSLVIEHLFSPCHGPSAFEVEAVVEYGFSIHAFIGADPSTEARTMGPHHLQVISSKYPGRLPPSAFQDCHDGTPMNINDITITELERLRPFTLVVSSTPLQPWSPTGSRLDWRDHRSRAFASIISFTRFYLSSQPTPVRYIVQNCPDALALPEVLSSFGACNIVRAASCGSEVHRDTLLWTIITQPQDIRNCGNNVAAIKLADPGPFSQQEGPHAPPPMLPSAALASAQEGPPPPHHNEQHPPHHQEGDATALSAPHTRKEAQLTSHYVDLSNYHPTLVASAIAAVVRPRSAWLTALALPAPTVRVSTAPRNYQEDISSTRPDDWTKSMNHEINSITTMALFVWVNVPELRRDNESQVIQQTAWAFAAQHGDGDIKREAGVIVRGNLLTTGETYAYDYLPLGCGRKVRAWHPVEALYDLPQASKAWFLSFSSFLHDFGFVGSEPGGVIHLHRETCIIDILTTFHMTKSKPRRRLCTLNTNFHNTAVAYIPRYGHRRACVAAGGRRTRDEGVIWKGDPGDFYMKVIAKKFRGVWHYGVITGVVTEWVLEDYGGATQWRAVFEDGSGKVTVQSGWVMEDCLHHMETFSILNAGPLLEEARNVVTEEDGPERKAQVDALTREGRTRYPARRQGAAAGAARRQGAAAGAARRQGAAAGAARRQGAAAGAARRQGAAAGAARRQDSGGRGSAAPRQRRPGQRGAKTAAAGAARRQDSGGRGSAAPRQRRPGQRGAKARRPGQRGAKARRPGQRGAKARRPGQRGAKARRPGQRGAKARRPGQRGAKARRPGQRGAKARRPGQRGAKARRPGQRGAKARRPGQRGAKARRPGQRGAKARRPGQRGAKARRPGQRGAKARRPGQRGAKARRPGQRGFKTAHTAESAERDALQAVDGSR